MTAVLRRLGAEGVKTAQARAILDAKGIVMPEHSMSVQLALGRTNDKLVKADLTSEQIQELTSIQAAAVEPNPEA